MIGIKEDVLGIHDLQCKFDRIEDKNKCLRVQFLDWLSNKMLVWSKQLKEVSDRIDAPCVIRFDKPVEHVSFFKELEQADYFFDPSMSTYTDIKGLKAGKSLEDCTFVMCTDGSLKSRAQSHAEMIENMKAASNSFDAKLNKLKKEFEHVIKEK